MSGFLRTVSQVAGVVATVAKFIPGGQTVSLIASAVAVTAGIGAAVTAKKPAAQGSSTSITISSSAPSEQLLGLTYGGGTRVHQVGYGTENDVVNAYLLAVDVYGVGGPYEALVGTYGDFTEIAFDGSGKAIGYYSNDTLYRSFQLGSTPEAAALAPHWAGAPDWGASFKLSGKPAIAWSARFPKDGKRFGSGFFQTGAIWKGVKVYDPRQDDTYPGGAGAHRYAPPTDVAGYAAAKATWEWAGDGANPGQNPGLHGLRYCLGTWERDESDMDAPYVKTFGIGLDWDSIIVEDFVQLANVCDDNAWTCNGNIYEPGDKWQNLKSILQAGGAEPCWRGGRLGLRISAPRVPLDIITRNDIADGELSMPGMQSFASRLNTIVPKYRSPDHKWEYVATQEPVKVLQFVTEDGQEKSEERQYNLVTSPDQAAQLAGYDLVNGREAGPIELPCKPRMRFYGPGDLLALDLPEAGLEGDYLVLSRSIDPATMVVTLTLVSENPAKHAYALGLTATAPPAITIQSPEDADGTANSGSSVVAQFAVAGDVGQASFSFLFPATDRWDYVRILGGTSPNLGSAIAVDGGPLTGAAGALREGVTDALDPGTWYLWAGVYDASDLLLSISNPLVVTVS